MHSSATLSLSQEQSLEKICKHLLQENNFHNQNELRESLIENGFAGISQSTVSRLLTQLGVIKIPNALGKKIYCLAPETSAIQFDSSIASQIDSIEDNKSMIVIKAKPGSAQLIARLIDFDADKAILGSIAGDDTVLVIPSDVNRIDQCKEVVRSILALN
ncbi:arginine repressor [Vibrio inusitatus NBRC 102082]|uniref:Arginine repressor n=1 Tax=Vibrio inusitatus NBRC 102082 TaxID=1219070 RepID=A0A4Y3I005_9VIBR|nr:arginine repressor [Vibrio inusitatus]GEA52773.1 arginine repressor [Vibrio inusitatus NBRC 102082]